MGSGSKRNLPCPCGSGKKYKKCCEGRKPTSTSVTVDFGVKTKVNEVRMGPKGEIELYCDGKRLLPERAWTGNHRERTKGEKSLLRIPIDPSAIQFGEVEALQKFDHIFAIDTNTKEIRGVKVSYACVCAGRFNAEENDPYFDYAILGGIEVHDGPIKAENFSWHLLFHALRTSPDYSKDHQYGVITDSDLGNHGAMNSQSAPYFGNHTLPNNITLVYAYDKGAALSNRMLKLCDNEARKMLNRFEDKSLPLDGASIVTAPVCSKFRGWLNNNHSVVNGTWFQLGSIEAQAFLE